MKIELTKEIIFQTARSGGKGGQNVNKVETMVEGYFHVRNSALLTDAQKAMIETRLASRINSEGGLQVRAQIHRSHLANKQEVVRKMEEMVAAALKKQKKRVPTKPTTGSKERRIEQKKKAGQVKAGRRRIRGEE